MTVGSAIFNRDTLALDDADLTQTLFEGINQRGWVSKTLMEKPYRREGLLRSRHERPRGHRAKQHAKIAAIQSCTMHIRFLVVDRRFIDQPQRIPRRSARAKYSRLFNRSYCIQSPIDVTKKAVPAIRAGNILTRVSRRVPGRTFCFVTSFPTGNEQGSLGMATVGNGAYSYEPMENWAKLPPGWSFKEIGGVGVDRNDNVFVFNRGEHPMIVFDREGNFLRSFGEGLFPRAHGVFMAPDDTVWLTDDGDHTVRQCTLEGKVLLTLGISGKPAPYMSGEPFHRCTHTAMSPQGDIYVSDGYGNSRVHKYAPNGKLLFSWGGPGTDPGEFNIAHNITCDADGWVYVADRENHRVQVFDGNGKYETQWNNLHRPCGLFMPPGKCPVCYIGELGAVQPVSRNVPNLGPRVTIVDNTGKRISRLGGFGPGLGPTEFLAPHGLAVDSRGDLYIGEVSWTNWPQTFRDKPRPDNLRSLHKFRKVG